MQDERDNRPAQAAKRDVDSPRPTPYMVPSLVKHLRFGPWLGPERFRARDKFDEVTTALTASPVSQICAARPRLRETKQPRAARQG